MSNIRCYTDDGDVKVGHVKFGKDFENGLLAFFAEMMGKVPKLNRLLDEVKLKAVIAQLVTDRKAKVKEIAMDRLGKKNDVVLPAGFQHFYETDSFVKGDHPMGDLIEQVIMGATGQINPPPSATIDGRIWYTPRRFLVSIPEENVIIDQADMKAYASYLVKNSRTGLAIASSLGGRKDEALTILEQDIKTLLASPGLRNAGRIIPCTIEIVTSRHAGADASVPTRAMRAKEDADAETIRDAIYQRVAMRMQSLKWEQQPVVQLVNASSLASSQD